MRIGAVAPCESALVDDPRFRSDLYRGTAADYDRFRLAYPATLVHDLVKRIDAVGGGRLLDLACGTGQVAFALQPYFREVVAVDQEAETVSFARAKGQRSNARNVQWITARAEAVGFRLATFDLVTIGNAFHRLQRRQVAVSCFQWLRPGGHIALLWGETPWEGPEAWQLAVGALVRSWMERMDATARVPESLQRAIEEQPNEFVLAEAGFEIVGKFEFVVSHRWTLLDLAGFVYSTSVLPRAVLGRQTSRFEAELRETVLAVAPDGRCHQDVSFAYHLARRPVGD